MATPVVVNGTTGWDGNILNKFIRAGEPKLQVQILYARVRYTGSAWEVVAGTDSAGLASVVLAWNGTDSQLEITLTDFTNVPLCLPVPVATDAAYNVKGHGSTATKAVVRFYNIDTGAKITSLSTSMDCQVLIIGY